MENLSNNEFYIKSCIQALAEYDSYMDSMYGKGIVSGGADVMQEFAEKHEVKCSDMKNHWKDLDYYKKNLKYVINLF